MTLKKTFVGAFMAAVALFGVASSASALTQQELLAQALTNGWSFDQFMSAYNMAFGGSSTGGSSTGSTTCGATTYGYTATSTLRPGMTGGAVSALQTALNVYGGASLVVDGSYGPATTAAVRSFQASKGLSQDGIAGPASQGALQNASMIAGVNCGNNNNNNNSGNTGPLQGTEGDLSFDISLDSDVQIDLGDSEEVIEFEAEAEDGDVMVDRVDFLFDERPWLYFDEVNLLADGEEIASLSSSSDFSETGNFWRARFSGLDQVIREDDTVIFTLELKVLGSMSGTRDQDTVQIDMDATAVRFTDGSGAIFQSDDAGLDNVVVDVTFSDTFGDGDISLSIGDNSPEGATIVLNEDARTNNVTVLEFNAEAEDSDIEIQDITVEFASNASDVEDILYYAYLYRGNTMLKRESVSSSTVVFDDLEYTIDEDDEESFTVKVDFNKVENGLVIDEFTVVDVVADAETSDFEAATDSLTVNEVHQLVVMGLVDVFDSKSASTRSLGDDTIGVFTFEFDLTAYEDDFYIDEDGADFGLTVEVGAGTTTATLVDLESNAFLTTDGSFRINKGQTRTFTLTVEVAATATGTPQSARVIVDDLTFWDDSDMNGVSDTLILGAPDYRSAQVSIIDAN